MALPYIFEHIHKTAGTTFLLSYLHFGFDEKERFIISGMIDENARTIDELNQDKRRYFIIGGINAFKLRDVYSDSQFITLIRDPVRRVVSLYLHSKYHPDCMNYYNDHINKKDISIQEFVEEDMLYKLTKDLMFSVQNYQYRLLCNDSLKDKNLKNAFQRYCLIGLTERIEEFIFALHIFHGFPLVLFNRRMVQKKGKAFHLTSEDREIILKCNQEDVLLYKMAEKKFEKLMKVIKCMGHKKQLDNYLDALQEFQDKTEMDYNVGEIYKSGTRSKVLLKQRSLFKSLCEIIV